MATDENSGTPRETVTLLDELEACAAREERYGAIGHAALLRRAAEAVRDAERYRWLRDESWRDPVAPGPKYRSLYDGYRGAAQSEDLRKVWLRYGPELDTAIDAAMKEER